MSDRRAPQNRSPKPGTTGGALPLAILALACSLSLYSLPAGGSPQPAEASPAEPSETLDPFLAQLPSLSPGYLFGQLSSPRPRWRRWVQSTIEARAPLLAEGIDRALRELSDAERAQLSRFIRALLGALPEGTHSAVEQLQLIGARLGLAPWPRFALYGLGLMPLFQLEIATPERLQARLEALSEEVGHRFTSYPVPGTEERWWRAVSGRAVLMVSFQSGILRVFLCHEGLEQRLLPRFLEPLQRDHAAHRAMEARWRRQLRTERGRFAQGEASLSGWLSLSLLSELLPAGIRPPQGAGASAPPAPGCVRALFALQQALPRISFAHREEEGALWLDLLFQLSPAARAVVALLPHQRPAPRLPPPGSAQGSQEELPLQLQLPVSGAGLLTLIDRFADALRSEGEGCALLTRPLAWAAQPERVPARYALPLRALEGISISVDALPAFGAHQLQSRVALRAPSLSAALGALSAREQPPSWLPPLLARSIATGSPGPHTLPFEELPERWAPALLSRPPSGLFASLGHAPELHQVEQLEQLFITPSAQSTGTEELIGELRIGSAFFAALTTPAQRALARSVDRWRLLLTGSGVQLAQRLLQGGEEPLLIPPR